MIDIKVELGDIPRRFGLLERQASYALSTSINRTLIKAQNIQQRYFRLRFNVSSQALPRAAFRIFRFSNAKTLTGTVGINRHLSWLTMHETGGTFRPRTARNYPVPMSPALGRRGRVARSKRPRNLARSFRIESKGRRFIFFRTGRGKRSRIAPAFSLNRTIRLRPRLKFVENVSRSIERHWQQEAERAAHEQLKRARVI